MGCHPGPSMTISAMPSSNLSESALVGIYEVSKLLASPNRLERTLAGVLALLSSFLDMRHGLFALLDKQGEPEIVVGSGWSETNAKKFFDHLPERAVGQIFATKMPLVIENVQTSPLFEGSDLSDWGPTDGQPFSLVGVPIKDGDTVVGTLTIDRVFSDRSAIRFDHDVRFLTMIANLVGQTLRLHKLISRDRDRLMQENARLGKGDRPTIAESKFNGIKGIVGSSPAVSAVIDKIRIVAKSRSTVLLRGESGTGKELFAAAIHNLSPRHSKPFVKLNCAALPESVLESELFGHERGAFTGAANLRKGRFELADGGTLFLDEIGEITPSFQAKLLRVLQEGEFERVGGSRTMKVDVRFVCATNKNLEEAVQKGEFRADLYYQNQRRSDFSAAAARAQGRSRAARQRVPAPLQRRAGHASHAVSFRHGGAVGMRLSRQHPRIGELRVPHRDLGAGRGDYRQGFLLPQRWLPVGRVVERLA